MEFNYTTLIPQPLVDAALHHWHFSLQPILSQVFLPTYNCLATYLLEARAQLNNQLSTWLPSDVLFLGVIATLLLLLLLSCISRTLHRIQEDGGLKASFFNRLRAFPPIKRRLDAEITRVRQQMLEAQRAKNPEAITQLPAHGLSAGDVLSKLRQRSAKDAKFDSKESSTSHSATAATSATASPNTQQLVKHEDDSHEAMAAGQSKLSGAIYMSGPTHKAFMDHVFSMFSITNPLHADCFPSIRHMEAEVVSMTASMLGGGPNSNNPDVCGCMTSGGSESILTAIKASRDYMKATRGIREPQMLVACSAHAAYWKAAEYFKLQLVVLPVGPDGRLSASTVRKALTRNTAIVVASAPGFPHGVIDDVAGIAALTRKRGICLHVDACLGGFVLPFARKLGRPIPPFDFSVPGVTSMSVDTHKFGMSHKGTSVLLYCSPSIRRHQYTSVTDWTGGCYISPGMAGSRPGALIATAWASLVHLGEQGFLDTTARILQATDRFVEGLQAIPELQLIGQPAMSVVAFKARDPKKLNIYKVSTLMTSRGWHLNALQRPPALHFCFTAAHAEVVAGLLSDLSSCVAQALASSSAGDSASVAMYGLANASPDRGLIAEFLVAYQDSVLSL